jgi:hypothetical protein
VNPNKQKPKPIFLQPWAFVTVTFLVTLISFFIPCKRLQSLRDQRAQETPEGLYQSTEKEGFFFSFSFFFILFPGDVILDFFSF